MNDVLTSSVFPREEGALAPGLPRRPDPAVVDRSDGVRRWQSLRFVHTRIIARPPSQRCGHTGDIRPGCLQDHQAASLWQTSVTLPAPDMLMKSLNPVSVLKTDVTTTRPAVRVKNGSPVMRP